MALECAAFRVLSRVVLNRMSSRTNKFVPEKTTLQAVGQLLTEIYNSPIQPKSCLQGLFVDYAKAFDSSDISILMQKLG